MKPVKKLEDASPEYRRLMNRHHDLCGRYKEIDAEVRRLHTEAGARQMTGSHGDRVNALLQGLDYAPAPQVQEKLAELAAERRAVDEAIRMLSGQIALERTRVSREIVAEFESDRVALAKEFFRHIAAAAAAHSKYGDMRRAFYAESVEPAGFGNFAVDLFGEPNHRNGDVGIALRHAAIAGFIGTKDIPEQYR